MLKFHFSDILNDVNEIRSLKTNLPLFVFHTIDMIMKYSATRLCSACLCIIFLSYGLRLKVVHCSDKIISNIIFINADVNNI